MDFGPVPPGQAAGAVLAHSVTLPSGRLRKGQVLTRAHVDEMLAEGMESVIVARLAATDLDEDAAATRIARALAGPAPQGLRLSNAFTGRVNLLAAGPGVVLLDPGRIHAMNRIHPMLTVATVPDRQQMTPGGMVATVKIIAYAVPETAVARAEAVLAGPPAIALAPVTLETARLIVTEIPGGAGEKGVEAIRGRLDRLGMALDRVTTVPHRQDALAEALAERAEQDLTLILTGSATSDPMDVAPGAVRQAGGHVERFGMPVDPGNLLFLGSLADRPVIGLPGCARSPALNGADWVLARVACGLTVTDDDIAGMGVGGLLKEIPTRPQPRDRRR